MQKDFSQVFKCYKVVSIKIVSHWFQMELTQWNVIKSPGAI